MTTDADVWAALSPSTAGQSSTAANNGNSLSSLLSTYLQSTNPQAASLSNFAPVQLPAMAVRQSIFVQGWTPMEWTHG